MSDAAMQGSGAMPAAEGPSAGAMLRQAREAAGLHVAALAVSMKVPVAKLEALEQDRYDLLPDAVFARALASSVCRTLKIDPHPVLDRLPQTSAPRLVQDTDGLNAPFRSPRDAVAPHWRDQLTRPVSLLVGGLLVAAAVVLLLPQMPAADQAVAAESAAPQAAAPSPKVAVADQPAAAPAAASPAAAEPAPSGFQTASIALSAPPAAAVPQPAAAPAAVAPPATAAAPAPAASAAAAPGPTDGIVVFRTSAQSWVEVRDARGAMPVRKLMTAGESAGASGAMPLQVTIGNAGATEVQVRGKPFDLRSIARDNVARFEIK
ncbi:helix-turn-helix domain-containing protein [Ramlibacter sp.]|uniref:helix-turn-helix domain-containing protein n=1 Tax=Ramlibacter sp. TaxID=1917967 RepID=UPI002C3880E8|nr:helix-turn-helix domain-containing protein [Ramlibacter sp.]HWI81672.1 helix-turn-helix domain-containing protein [Ramlibacter sp.]